MLLGRRRARRLVGVVVDDAGRHGGDGSLALVDAVMKLEIVGLRTPGMRDAWGLLTRAVPWAGLV